MAGTPYDYDAVAESYDRHRRGAGPYLEPLTDLARAQNPQRVLEIGPGTGNVTLEVAARVPCEFIGMDLSWGMLQEARAKTAAVAWLQGDACRLPFARASIDFAFAVLVLHHIADLPALCAECRRVVRGAVAFVTASHEFIDRHPMTAYFPSFSAVDKKRFPAISVIERELSAAGFQHVRRIETRTPPQPIDRAYANKVRDKFISTYDLIPEDEFALGVETLDRDIAAKGQLDAPMIWEATIVSATV